MDLITTIKNSVENAYGSVAFPSWHFVEKEYRKTPYLQTIRSLRSASFDVEETTDLNEDVSCAYYLRKGAKRWSLQLSLVGRFAVLLSVDEHNRVSFDLGRGQHEMERIIAKSYIILLTEEILSRSIPFGESGKEKRVYFLLFSDLDELPWQVGSDPSPRS